MRMMTKFAEQAVSGAGLEALKCDPSWGPFLADNRIGAVLKKREMTLGDHPELKRAVDTLCDRAETLRQEAEKKLEEEAQKLSEEADRLRTQGHELVKGAI